MIDTGAASVTDSQFVLQPNELRGTAQVLDRSGEGDIKVSRGSFTRCEPGNDEWRLTSSTMNIANGSKFGTATNAVLRVHDVPVFYTQYIRFPVTNERMSGWLFPDIAVGDANSTDIAVPAYRIWRRTTCDDYAALHLRAGFRSRRRIPFPFAVWKGYVGGAFLPKDDDYNGQYSRTDFDNLGLPSPFDPANRWLFTAKQQGTYGAFSTEVNTTKVSDFDYFRDLGSNLASASQVRCSSTQPRPMRTVDHRRLWVQAFSASMSRSSSRTGACRRSTSTTRPAVRPGGVVGYVFVGELRAPERPVHRHQQINGDRLNIQPRVRLPFDWTPGFRFHRRLSVHSTTSMTCRLAPTRNPTGRSGWAPWTAACSSNASPNCSAAGSRRWNHGCSTSISNTAIRTATAVDVSDLSFCVRSALSRQPLRRYRPHRRRQSVDRRDDVG
jgi:hypothetical protein